MKEEVLSRLGKQIAELRGEKGWTQEQLANEAGLCGKKLICKIENGQGNPRLHTLCKIATALGAVLVANMQKD